MEKASLPPDLTGLLIRVNTVEQQVQQVQAQLQQYVPASVNDLQLQSIRSSVDRIERDVVEMKHQLTDMNTKLTTQEAEAQKRDSAQRESQDKLQIRVLWGFVSAAITVLLALLIAYLTHYIH